MSPRPSSHPFHPDAPSLRTLVRAAAVGQLLLIGACARDRAASVTGVRVPEAGAVGAIVVDVSTVDELYAAVYDPANAGATVRLARGTYVLSAKDGLGAPRPRAGTLRLQPGMSLVGAEERVDHDGDGVPDAVDAAAPDGFTVPGTATVIDGSALVVPKLALVSCAGEVQNNPDPLVHLARDTRVADLTVNGGPNVTVGEPIVAVEPGVGVSAEVTGTVLRGTGLVATFANGGCSQRGAHSTLRFSRNVIRGSSGNGISIANYLTGDASNSTEGGPSIDATFSENRLLRLLNALVAGGGQEGTDGGTISLEMQGNVFTLNGVNVLLRGGFAKGATPTVGNHLRVTSHGDTFGAPTTDRSVVAYAGRQAPGLFAPPFANTLEANFIHDTFVHDSPLAVSDLWIAGADGGSDNHAVVLVRQARVTTSAGAPTEGMVTIRDAIAPGDATNTARLRGSPRAFERTNQGLAPPPAHYFFSGHD